MDIPNYLLPTRSNMRDSSSGYAYHQRMWIAPPSVRPEHLVNPNFWVHVAEGMPVHSRIEVISQTGEFEMELRVTGVDPRGKYMTVRVLRFIEHGGVAIPGAETAISLPPDSYGYTIERDRVQGWRVFLGKDMIAHGLPDKAAAEAARDAHRAGRPIKKVA